MPTEWFFSKGGQQLGPVSSEQLKQLAASDQLQPSDLVWKDGMSQWIEARKVKGVFPPPTVPSPQVQQDFPQPAATPQQWYYVKDGQQRGPVSAEQLTQLTASGQLLPRDLVWEEGMAQWVEVRTIRGLVPAQATQTPPFPPPIPQSASVPVSGLPLGAVSDGHPPRITEGVTFDPPIPQLPGPSSPADDSPLGFLDTLQEASVTSGPQWYYNSNGNRVGPVDDAAITRLLDAGMLTNDTFVWRRGLDGWIPMGQTTLRKRPALWYVNDAAWLGVLLIGWIWTAAIAFVLAGNWKALGNKAGARRCMIWFFSIPVGLFLLLAMAGQARVTTEPGEALGLLIVFGTGIASYVALYFLELKPQITFVRKHLHVRYIHKSWWPPLGIAAAAYVSLVIAFTFLSGVSANLPINIYNDPNVTLVKTGHLSAHPNKTIGEAANAFIGNPRWESGTAQDGTELVNVRGNIRFMDKPVEAVLQFEVNRRLGTFEVRALEFNGVPQNRFVQIGFLEKMYESCH